MTEKELLLFESAENGDGFKLIELMEEGVNLNYRNEDGMMPLMVYLDGGYASIEVIKLAIIKGAEINAKDSNGDTILDIAEFMDLHEIVEYLISKGAQGANGKSYRDRYWDEIYQGMDAANDIKFGEYYGQKLLEVVAKGDVEQVREIMSLPREKGGILIVRLTQKDQNGKTALDIAKENGNEEIIKIFESREGKENN